MTTKPKRPKAIDVRGHPILDVGDWLPQQFAADRYRAWLVTGSGHRHPHMREVSTLTQCEWLIQGGSVAKALVIQFEDKSDAVLFKLTFGGV